jgi:hypothetical protein
MNVNRQYDVGEGFIPARTERAIATESLLHQLDLGLISYRDNGIK